MIKYSKQLIPFLRVRAVPYFLQIASFDIFYVRFVYFAAIAQVWIKSSSTTCLLYSDVVKGDPSPTRLRRNQEEDEEGAVKRAVKESRFSFHKYFITFFIYFYYYFLSITLLYHFFYTFLYPRHLPTPTRDRPTPSTHDHYPRPTTFSYTPFG